MARRLNARRRVTGAASACALVLLLGGCGSSSPSTGAPGAASATSTAASEGGSPSSQGPLEISIAPPAAVARAGGSELAAFNLGRSVAARAGCLGCHRIGSQGKAGPGPNLSYVGSMLPAGIIERVLIEPEPPMPSFAHLPRSRFRALVRFLSLLRCPGRSRELLPHGC